MEDVFEIKTIKELPDLSHFIVKQNTKIDIKLKLKNQKLIYQINIIHNQPNLLSEIKIKIALFKNSYLEIPVNITIQKNAIDSFTSFNATVFILDEQSKAKVTPGLHIFEKEIKGASHGLIIKNIKKRDTYYLQSRGFTFEESKNLIIGF